jgi:prophage maintenance system killer protein
VNGVNESRVGQTALPHGEILVYEDPDGRVRVDVRVDQETVWLTQQQMAELFGRDKSVISRHLRNVFQSGELERQATVAKIATVHQEGGREVVREIEYFNLDAILSVGYRVNSKRGTQFRIWATKTLRDHLLRGYTLHERRLAERGLAEAEQAIALLARTLTSQALVTDEGRAVLEVVQSYSRSWRWLLEYDEGRLSEQPRRAIAPIAALTLPEARAAAARLREELLARGEAGPLFGQERGEALAAILAAIEQTFDGQPLYPSVQARAAHLLYFVIKDHPFGDGNKRIGALLFLEYLRRHGLLLRAEGTPRLADNAMVALALLIAESAPAQKDLMIRLTLNLLEDDA